MDLKEAGQKWEKLHLDWVLANQEARRAELKNQVRFNALMGGKGAGPSEADIELADKLRRAANDMLTTCDEFVRSVLR